MFAAGFVVPHNRCAAAAIAVNHANEIVAGGAEFLLRLYYITCVLFVVQYPEIWCKLE